MKYFLITGMDEGVPITPYIVEVLSDYPSIALSDNYGDRVRYYTPLTAGEVVEYMKDSAEV